jgi:hypothetical protein
MAQVVERLLCKYKALSSNSIPTKKEKEAQTSIKIILALKGIGFYS